MERRLPPVLWVVLGALLPALFVLDWLVDQTGRRETTVHGVLEARVDGNQALAFEGPLRGGLVDGRLELSGESTLSEGGFPWPSTPFGARLWIRLDPALEAGVHEEGFVANWVVWSSDRAELGGTPPVPCKGRLDVRALEVDAGQGLEGLRAADLHLDLLCTSAGPDLRFGTGDEHVWTVVGELRLSSERRGAPANDPE